MVKNLPSMQETSLSKEDPLEEGMETHFIMLAWRISWREEPGGLQSWGHKKSDMIRATGHTISWILLFCHLCSMNTGCNIDSRPSRKGIHAINPLIFF